MLLTEILTPARVKVPLTAGTKEGVISELIDLLTANGDLKDGAKVFQAVMEREKTRTTGIGSGLAIPHGKSAGVSQLVMAVGKPASPVEYQSIDGRPVNLIFLLVSPMDMTGPHIQALARISRLISLDSFRNRLLAAQTSQDLFAAIKGHEEP